MAQHKNISHRVMEIVIRSPGCGLEEVILECPDLTWNQVFLELDRLSHAGRVVLRQKGPGFYTVAPCADTTMTVAAPRSH